MALLNLSKLAESVESTFNALKSLFGIDGGKSKADHPVVKDNPDLATLVAANYDKPYNFTFSVVTKDNSDKGTGFIEFPLPIAPSNLTIKEPVPTKIRATQGGTAVFRNGIKYREISIKGTMGIYPSRGVLGISKDGVQRGAGKTGGTEGVKKASGYEAFMRFRNWFRAFYIQTKDNADSKDFRLVFNNYKDGEFLIVEILSFTTIVDASKPLMMDYDIQMKVLGSKKAKAEEEPEKSIFEQIDDVYSDIIDKIDGVRAVFLGAQDILRQLDSNINAVLLEPLRRISMAVKAANNTNAAIADIGPGIKRTLITASLLLFLGRKVKLKSDSAKITGASDVVDLPNNLEDAIDNQGPDFLDTLPPEELLGTDLTDMPDNILVAHEEERAAARALPRKSFEDDLAGIMKLGDNASDKFGVGSTEYDALDGRTSTIQTDDARTPTDREFEVLAAFEEARKAYNALITSQEFFKTTYAGKIDDINTLFDNNIALQAEAGIREYIVGTNRTLEEIALFELGDATRWVEIAELNNLQDPFIVQDRTQKSDGVVAPGDKIMIPTGGDDFGNINIFRDSPLLDDLTHLEKSMGIDLKLDKNMDLELTNTGDFLPLRGLDNAVQAIILKLMYNKGELLEHPEIGVGITIGSKTKDIGEMRANIVETLTADPRFEGISDMAIIREGGTIKINFAIKLKNVDIPVPLELRI